MRGANRRAGFTLVEVMTAVAILGIATSLAFGVFAAQRQSYQSIKSAIEVQQDVRLLADTILSDIRMAGYMVPQQAGITSVDGGANAADWICLSDPDKIDDTAAENASARFDGAATTVNSTRY